MKYHIFTTRFGPPPEITVSLTGGIRAPADIRPLPTSTHGGAVEPAPEDDVETSD